MEWSNEPINSSPHRPEEEQNVGRAWKYFGTQYLISLTTSHSSQ